VKDDKKKQIIIAILAFIIVGVGAFQFIGGGSKAAPPLAAKKPVVTADADAKPTIKNPEFAMAYPTRNPFEVPEDESAPKKPQLPTNTAPPTKMSGNLGNLPPLAVGGPGAANPTLNLVPTEQPFPYKLSGLIDGRHPAAVFMDSGGAQRLVPLGSSLDGDAKLVAVRDGLAVVSYHGKHLRLSLGGSPDAN
jgi:hypothetical protein